MAVDLDTACTKPLFLKRRINGSICTIFMLSLTTKTLANDVLSVSIFFFCMSRYRIHALFTADYLSFEAKKLLKKLCMDAISFFFFLFLFAVCENLQLKRLRRSSFQRNECRLGFLSSLPEISVNGDHREAVVTCPFYSFPSM